MHFDKKPSRKLRIKWRGGGGGGEKCTVASALCAEFCCEGVLMSERRALRHCDRDIGGVLEAGKLHYHMYFLMSNTITLFLKIL